MTATESNNTSSTVGLLRKLHTIKWGSAGDDPSRIRLPAKVIGHFFETLALLLENGLSLQRALMVVDSEGTLRKHQTMLTKICQQVEAGETFSKALAAFPRSFGPVVIKQLRIAEKSGQMVEALQHISNQLKYRRKLRSRVTRKLSYPALVMFAGSSLVCFMMLVVVPQFEKLYADSDVELPLVTQLVSAASRSAFRYGWITAAAGALVLAALLKLRKHPQVGSRIDRLLLRIPLLGGMLRDLAVLQFVDAVNTMVESGYVPADAISESVDGVTNRAVRETVQELRIAVLQGGKLSDELAKYPDVFPATVSQLVFVGEETGTLAKSTRSVREYLCERIENRVNTMVGMLEPLLTLTLATAIGFVVLAIYMPMFNMFEVLE